MLALLLICVFVQRAASILYEGDKCTDIRTTTPGRCWPAKCCGSALDDLQNRINPTLCSFSGTTAIVCCRYGCSDDPTGGCNVPGAHQAVGELNGVKARKSETMCIMFDKISELSQTQNKPPRPIFVSVSPQPAKIQRSRRDASGTGDDSGTDDESGTVGIAAVGGEDTELDEFPHMAAIGWPLKAGTFAFYCGGSLISDRWVLTAGHCLYNSRDTSLSNPEPTIVRLGDQNILDTVIDGAQPLDTPISRRIRHPNYKPPSKYYDIALVELVNSVPFSKHIKPACLWTKEDFGSKTSAIVTGWGTTVSGAQRGSAVLQKVKLDILSTDVCQPLHRSSQNRNWQGFSDHQLCAGVLAGGKDACQGDSGGPLQIQAPGAVKKYYLIGVTSFGRDCAKPNLPGVYTRVSSFVDWIEKVVWP